MPRLDLRSHVRAALLGLTCLAAEPRLTCLAADPADPADPGSLQGEQPPTPEPAAAGSDRTDLEDRFRKARLLGSDRWRRAVSAFEAWLASQPVYTPAQARAIRSDLDRRVAAMTSYEVEYLLDTLDAKLRILDSPAAREAREWLGRYLAVMADHKRAEVLAELPNVLDMTTADLVAGLERLQAKRAAVEQQRRVATSARAEFAAFLDAQRRIDALAREARTRIRLTDVAFSPYRAGPVADPPFADVGDGMPFGPMPPWGPFTGLQVGGF
jgi:hypothetical protein